MITKTKYRIVKCTVFFIKLVQMCFQAGLIYYTDIINDRENFQTFSIIINAVAIILNFCHFGFALHKTRLLYVYQQDLIVAAVIGVFHGTYTIIVWYIYSDYFRSVIKNSKVFEIDSKFLEFQSSPFLITIILSMLILFVEFPILYLSYVMKLLIRKISREEDQQNLLNQHQQSFQLQPLLQQQNCGQQHQSVQQNVEHQHPLNSDGLLNNGEQITNENSDQYLQGLVEINESFQEMISDLEDYCSKLYSSDEIPAPIENHPNELASSVGCEVQPEEIMQNACTIQSEVVSDEAGKNNIDRSILPSAVNEMMQNASIKCENPSVASPINPVKVQEDQNEQNISISSSLALEKNTQVTQGEENTQL